MDVGFGLTVTAEMEVSHDPELWARTMAEQEELAQEELAAAECAE